MNAEYINSQSSFEALCLQSGFEVDRTFQDPRVNFTVNGKKLSVLLGIKSASDFNEFQEKDLQSPAIVQSAAVIGGILVGSEIIAGPLMRNAAQFDAVQLRHLSHEHVGKSMFMHFITMLGVVQSVEYTGEHVLDFGAGTGVMSLIAKRRKAQEVTLIELDRRALNMAHENLRMNRFSDEANLIYGDFGFEFDTMRHLPNATVGFANIGPHRIYGGDDGAHMSVPRVVGNHFPNIHTMFIGGYTRKEYSMNNVLTEYRRIGFEVDQICSFTVEGNDDAYESAILRR
ncbi:hypothetical protein COY16_01905 [Candidatus Roizmanbacteria bacterium CG_4_10_14_0_2_um_filter_39_13]|uniref:Uncharacterized protein n=1 Tax=Candidatus Roizmanbacteria bacterium CG_4_10_14_0_2_um_filter_39_13 TaxID=1974825 RepID=A0A2M7U0C9_9BACT|nr:MAG: hypothetical protein COY16_01905 [Candidatus Roizmanbacteria bacterium CG_4_10_14_0_2_um_filter_39_13]